jgi:hypothetical protein
MALYDPVRRRIATRSGHDFEVVILSFRSWAQWLLGYPEAALADADHALKTAREIGHAAILMEALSTPAMTHTLCGNYSKANAQLDELVALANEKGALYWKAIGMMQQRTLLALTGKASEAVRMITSRIAEVRPSGTTMGWGHISREPMRNSANLMSPGAASAKR